MNELAIAAKPFSEEIFRFFLAGHPSTRVDDFDVVIVEAAAETFPSDLIVIGDFLDHFAGANGRELPIFILPTRDDGIDARTGVVREVDWRTVREWRGRLDSDD